MYEDIVLIVIARLSAEVIRTFLHHTGSGTEEGRIHGTPWALLVYNWHCYLYQSTQTSEHKKTNVGLLGEYSLYGISSPDVNAYYLTILS